MKLLGKDIPAHALVDRIQDRLLGRSVVEASASPLDFSGPEPRLSPASFHLSGLQEHADPAPPLSPDPLLKGAARLLSLGRYGMGRLLQVPLGLAFARQRLFNEHTKDAYAQLAAELLRLQNEVAALRAKAKRTKG